jgi:hypothetical protein
MEDRRRGNRERCLLGAKIEYNDRRSIMDCVIRDRSPSGMRIRLPEAATIPVEFDLVLPDRGQKHKMRVVWRVGDQIGLTVRGSMGVAA